MEAAQWERLLRIGHHVFQIELFDISNGLANKRNGHVYLSDISGGDNAVRVRGFPYVC